MIYGSEHESMRVKLEAMKITLEQIMENEKSDVSVPYKKATKKLIKIVSNWAFVWSIDKFRWSYSGDDEYTKDRRLKESFGLGILGIGLYGLSKWICGDVANKKSDAYFISLMSDINRLIKKIEDRDIVNDGDELKIFEDINERYSAIMKNKGYYL